ncbi:MAG: PAS domain S-box protein, partial [Kovacikia sp.]
MASEQVEGPSDSTLGNNTELQWLPFLLNLTEKSTTDSIQDIGKFVLTYLMELAGAAFGDIKLLIEGEGSRTEGGMLMRPSASILPTTSAQFVAIAEKNSVEEFSFRVYQTIPYRQGIFWQVVETGAPVFVDDYATHPNAIDQFRQFEGVSLGIFPIPACDGTVIGVLTLVAQDLQRLQTYPSYDVVRTACRIMGTVIDRERTQQELKLAEERLQLAQFSLEHMSDACFWLGADGRIEAVNEAACQYLGYSRQELLTLTVGDIDPNFPPESWSSFWEQHGNWNGSTFESLHRTREGQMVPVEITGNHLEFRGREYCFTSVRNISDRKHSEAQQRQAEEALRRSEARFRRIADSNIIGIIFSSSSGEIHDANDAFLEMVGYTREDLEASRVRWDAITPPEYSPLDAYAAQQLSLTGTTVLWEKEYIHKDGSRVAILIGCAL